ncbi:MAG: hypothetical protein E6R03_08150 [Hyphomicrobiaceae bacterium]|nr:MAG: hypothetical protein E6R03_08150 [Hyphomicrobiaceae bacterium]
MAELNWKDLGGQLIQLGAPVIGGALLGPLGSTLGGALGTIVAETLGVPATPSGVKEALDKMPGEAAATALSVADRKAEIELEKFKLQLADVQSARQMTETFVKSSSVLQYGSLVVSMLVTIGFFVVLFFLLNFKSQLAETTGQVMLILVGSLASMQVQVVNYWLGSSAGSADKTQALTSLSSVLKK